jgi:hypothetical protein
MHLKFELDIVCHYRPWDGPKRELLNNNVDT